MPRPGGSLWEGVSSQRKCHECGLTGRRNFLGECSWTQRMPQSPRPVIVPFRTSPSLRFWDFRLYPYRRLVPTVTSDRGVTSGRGVEDNPRFCDGRPMVELRAPREADVELRGHQSSCWASSASSWLPSACPLELGLGQRQRQLQHGTRPNCWSPPRSHPEGFMT